MNDKKLITVKEFANMYGIGLSNAYELVYIKDFPVVFIGKKILIIASEVDRWLIENKGQNLKYK